MVPRDTSVQAAELQNESYRRMGNAGRLRIALELSDLTHAFAVAGLRRTHPNLTDDGANRELAGLLYGRRP